MRLLNEVAAEAVRKMPPGLSYTAFGKAVDEARSHPRVPTVADLITRAGELDAAPWPEEPEEPDASARRSASPRRVALKPSRRSKAMSKSWRARFTADAERWRTEVFGAAEAPFRDRASAWEWIRSVERQGGAAGRRYWLAGDFLTVEPGTALAGLVRIVHFYVVLTGGTPESVLGTGGWRTRDLVNALLVRGRVKKHLADLPAATVTRVTQNSPGPFGGLFVLSPRWTVWVADPAPTHREWMTLFAHVSPRAPGRPAHDDQLTKIFELLGAVPHQGKKAYFKKAATSHRNYFGGEVTPKALYQRWWRWRRRLDRRR